MGKYIFSFFFFIGLMFLSTDISYGMPLLEDGGPSKQLSSGKVIHVKKKKSASPKPTVIVKEIHHHHHHYHKTPCSFKGAAIATGSGIVVGGIGGAAMTGGPGALPGAVAGGATGLAAYNINCLVNGGTE
jgi:hypothetical protein